MSDSTYNSELGNASIQITGNSPEEIIGNMQAMADYWQSRRDLENKRLQNIANGNALPPRLDALQQLQRINSHISGFTQQDEDNLKHGLMRSENADTLPSWYPRWFVTPARYISEYATGAYDMLASTFLDLPAWWAAVASKRAKYLPFIGSSAENALKSVADTFTDWKTKYGNASQNLQNKLFGTQRSMLDEWSQGAGSITGYMLGGSALGGLFGNALGLGEQAVQAGQNIGKLQKILQYGLDFLGQNALESATEAGQAFTSNYAKDKSRLDDALNAASASFFSNAPLDMLQSGAEGILGGWLDKLMPGSEKPIVALIQEGLKHLVKEEFNEILQEPRQQLVEEAVRKTFDSNNVSLRNYLHNLIDEGAKFPEYVEQTFLPTVGSTALGTAIMGLAGFPFGRLRRHHNQNQKTEAQLINERNNLITERDKVADEINRIYESFSDDLDTDIQVQNDLNDLLQYKYRLDNAINDFWKDRGISSTPVQDDDLDLFPDRNELNSHFRGNNTPDDNTPPSPATPTAPNAPTNDDDFRIENLTPFGRGNQNNNTRSASSLSDSPEGNTARIRTMRGTEADIRYRIVDADELITSTKDTGAPNPDYPQEFQPRQRDRDASHEQVNRIANNLDPELVADNRLASDGAPIIGSDLIVESGNGRVMGIRQAYRNGKAEHYRTWLKDNAARFGLSPDYVDSIKNPVLVRERISNVDRVQFTREANESSTAQMSATENALNDAKQISPEILALFDPEKSIAGNKDFASAFSRIIPASERGNFMQSNGNISASGLLRIRNALAAKAYNDTSILNRLDEFFDDDIKNVSNALINAAPKIAMLENGGYKPNLSIKDDIVQAVNTLAGLKKEGRTVDEFIAQIPMFDDISDNAKRLILFFDKNKRSAKRISQGLIHYAELAMNQGSENQIGLPGFDDAVLDKTSLLKEAMKFADSLKSENYNQSDYNGNERSDVGHITANDNGQDLDLTLETAEFSDKHQKQKQFFGKFFNIKDSKTGRIIARYAPYTGKLQMLDENASPEFRQQIENTIRNHLNDYLERGGFIDENGKLKDDGNNEYRRQYRSRLDTTPEGKSVHEFNKRGNTRKPKSWLRRFFDKRRFSKQERIGFEKVREDIKDKIYALNVDGDENEKNYISEQDAEFYAAFYAGEILATAHKAGVAVEEYYKIRNLQFRTKVITDEDIRNNNNNVTLGNTEFIPAGYLNEETGKHYDTSATVITLFMIEGKDKNGNTHYYSLFNKSTLIHEGWHSFLRAFQDVMRLDNVPEQVRKDWLKLVKWLGISDIDLSKPTDKMTPDEKRRMRNAHEKFAVAGEHFIAKGKAPVSWLKRVFNTFKQWLLDVYGVITNAQYAGSDGRHHDVVVPKEIEAVFKRMFKDYGLSPDEDNLRTLREMAGREGESELHNQTVNEEYETAHHVSRLQSHSPIRRTNDTFVSQQDIERFEQLAFHGTGHIIFNNSFDLKYIGSGEGNLSYGWGLYFSQIPDVAETYRRYGIPDDKNGGLSISTKDGKTFYQIPHSFGDWSGNPDTVLETVLKDFANEAVKNPDADTKEIIQNLKSRYANEQLPFAPDKKYYVLDSISSFSVNPQSNGNLYNVDIPENDVLLNWDTKKQPKKVQKAMQKVISRLYSMGAYEDDIENVANSKTGKDFYNNLKDALEPFIENDSLPFKFQGKNIIRSDLAASLLLNQAGIPGLCYLDEGSRFDGEGTYNFVIWNTDTIEILDVEGDKEAVDYFNANKNNETERYNQYAQDDAHIYAFSMKDINGNPIQTSHEVKSLISDVISEMPEYILSSPKAFDAHSSTKNRIEYRKKEAQRKQKKLLPYGHKYDDEIKLYDDEIKLYDEALKALKYAASLIDSEGRVFDFNPKNPKTWENIRMRPQPHEDIQQKNKPKFIEVNGLMLTLKAKKQYDEVVKKYKGTSQWLKAPNGKKSNLNENQWVLVRTPNFKQWFGDWEYNPEHASKVLDENGEPLVVYHGTSQGGFSHFNVKGQGKTAGTGAFFHSNKDAAKSYFYSGTGKIHKQLYAVFLNIRNPYVMDAKGNVWDNLGTLTNNRYSTTDSAIRAVWRGNLGNGNHDGVIFNNIRDSFFDDGTVSNVFVTPEPRHIKSATDNNGNFGNNREIYKQSVISELRTEAGHSAEEAEPSELLLTPNGSKIFGFIDEKTAKIAGVHEGIILMDVQGLMHTKLNKHNNEILHAGYPNVETFFIDVLRDYDRIYQGSNDSLLLVKHLNKHNGVAAIELVPDRKGTYLVKTGLVIRDRGLKNKKLLFSRSEPFDNSPAADEVLQTSSINTGENAPNAMLKSNNHSLISEYQNVNSSDTEHYNQIIGINGAKAIDKANGNTQLMDNLDIARQMERNAVPVKTMWAATGWMRGADGQWRYEIPDGKFDSKKFNDLIQMFDEADALQANLKFVTDGVGGYTLTGLSPDEENRLNTLNDAVENVKLSDVFDAPELFYAYPELKNIEVAFDNKSNTDTIAEYDPDLDFITFYTEAIRDMKPNEIRRTLIHEIQHAVQGREGFASGGSLDSLQPDANGKVNLKPYFRRTLMRKRKVIFKNLDKKIQRKFNHLRRKESKLSAQEFNNLKNKLLNENEIQLYDDWRKSLKLAQNLNKHGHEISHDDAYWLIGGEEEARNTENRADLSPEERRNKPLNETEDHNRNAHILLNKYGEHYTESYNQNSVLGFSSNGDEFVDTPQQQLDNVRKKYEGTSQWLKAPNGKTTNLTEKQWLQVRTPNFKQWFGDWENDPQNASKILDENGEPLVLYHGTPKGDFSVFDTKGHKKTKGTGAWFTPDIKAAAFYSEANGSDNHDKHIYPVFLNIRNPYIHDAQGKYWEELGDVWILDHEGFPIYHKNDGSPFINEEDAIDYLREVLHGEDEKDSLGYYRYEVQHDTEFNSTDDIVRGVWIGDLGYGNHDGVIFKNVVDPEFSMDDYIIPNNTQVKSATRNNGDFSEKPEIYQQIIGEKGARDLDRAEGVTTRMDNLIKAKIMRKNKISPKNIKLATGWELAPDGKWRYEIQDILINSQALFNAINTHGENLPFSLKLHELYNNKSLFNAYPELKNMHVIFKQNISDGKNNTLGIYVHGKDKHIELKAISSIEKLRSVLIHEIQHAVQDIEGFAQGGYGSLSIIQGKQAVSIGKKFLHALLHTSTPNVRKAARLFMKGDTDKANNIADNMLPAEKGIWKRVLRTINDINHSQFRTNTYNYLGGEIEARNAETRADFSDEQRRYNTLQSTQDNNEWLVVQDNKPQNFSVIQDFTQNSAPESYNQIIGEKGARAIDKANGNTNLIDNLNIAKQMMQAGKNKKTIRLATGWEMGSDNNWKYEIPDGNLRHDSMFNWHKDGVLSYWTTKLGDIFDAHELFNAYPQLKSLPVSARISEFDITNPANYSSDFGHPQIEINKLYVNQNNGKIIPSPRKSYPHLRSSLLHEIQHAVQNIEGFPGGSNMGYWAERNFTETQGKREKILQQLKQQRKNIEKISGFDEYDKSLSIDMDWAEYDEKVNAFWENSSYNEEYKRLNQKIRNIIDILQSDSLEKQYLRALGEREARNVETRQNFSDEQRRNTLLAETEDDKGRFKDENGQFIDELDLDNLDYELGNESYYQTSNNTDNAYFDALLNDDLDSARNIVDEQARKKGYTSNPDDYRMPHRAPNRQYDFNLDNINHDDYFMPKDLWTRPQLYFSSREEIAAIRLLKRAADNHSDVTVYRAVIDSVKDSKLRNGDWVTTDRNYAVLHGEQHLRAPYRIIQDTVPLKHLWWNGESPLELGFDDGNNYAYRNTKNNRKLNDTVVRDDNGNIVPPSKRFNYRKSESYYQQNTFVSRYSFSDDDTEQQFTEAKRNSNPADNKKSLKHYLLDALHGLKGDFPELAAKQAKQKDLTFAREVFRMLKRKSDAQIQMAVHSLSNSLDALSPEQFDIFTRMLLINDIYAFKRQNPNAPLPLGFTAESLKNERIRFSKLIQNQPEVLKAAQDEANLNSKIKHELASLAREMGLQKLADKVTRNEFNSAMLDYANIISPNHNDINANYIHAMGTFRAQQLQDILRLQAIRDIKAKYDIKDKLIKQFGSQWGLHIPNGYKSFNILAGHFIEAAHSLHENILGKALEATAQQLGLSDETIKQLRESVSEKSGSQLLVLPNEIVDSILYMLAPKHRRAISQFLRNITGAWKKHVLYFPTRVAKYNLRNLTGDLDAVIAGNPNALKFLKQAVSELYDAYLGNAKNITPELLEFQKRGGAITTETSQELYDYHKLKQFKHLINAIDDKNPNSWKSIPAKTWELIDKIAWSGVQNLTDFREAWLRYACYLSYLNQMQNNEDNMPDNWGASVPDEVLSIPDIRDRAFKMSNELIGAYDQVSQTGQALRELFIPFYSWLEVNAKRYYQLLKNGFSSDKPVDFMIRSLEGLSIKSPVYAYRIGKTLFMVNLLALLVKAFNHFVWPDDEDKLPPDIKERPHITLGHDPVTGDVLYFDRIGAVADNLEWFRGDAFFSDIKAILNGKLSVTQWVKMLLAAPVNKIMQGINPIFKAPFELATGKSLYPDFTNPRNIQDKFKYIAQSLGLNWPFKIISGEPHSTWDEFRNLFVYGTDADEAAYFYTLNLVRQFSENVLGKRSGGFSYSQRGLALQNLKRALRVDDKDAINRYLQDYFRLNGNNKGLKASLRNLNPLHSLNKHEQAQFLKWISDDDRIYFDRANSYVQTLLNRFAER